MGQVGISTNNPTKELDVNGEIRVRSTNNPLTTNGNEVIGTDSQGNIGWIDLTKEKILLKGIPIPICNEIFSANPTTEFNATIEMNGSPVEIKYYHSGSKTSADVTETVRGTTVLKNGSKEHLLIRYDFPFFPNGSWNGYNGSGNHRITLSPVYSPNPLEENFSLAYYTSQNYTTPEGERRTEVMLRFARVDEIGDTSQDCWDGIYYFDLMSLDTE
ncbi:MAG: hypothetical protein DWP94_07320 [Flavobacterium sp.]|nr:MAG: hypothetical protein DWP94_07320 [Flavobacterium sp.]